MANDDGDLILNDGQRQVRAIYEQQRPKLDSATQKLWDDWCDIRIGNFLKTKVKFNLRSFEHADVVADEMGRATGQMERRLMAEINELRAEVAELRKAVARK